MGKIDTHKIGQYIDQLTGFPFESSRFNQNGLGYRLLRGINVTRGSLRFDSDNEMFYEDGSVDFSKYFLKENDIVISMDGSLVGRNFAKVKQSLLPLLLVQRVARIRTNPDLLNQDYLYQFFTSEYFIKYVDSVKTSSGIPHISSKQINDFAIPILPIKEQAVVANILGESDQAIEKTHSLILKNETKKKGVMQKLLTGRIRFREFEGEEIIKGKLSDYVDLLHGYQFRKEDFTEDGIPVIKIGNVNGYDLDLTDLTFISTERLNEFNDVVIKNGDLLMSLTGNIGRVVEVRNISFPMMQNYRVGKFITRNKNILTQEYLKHLLGSEILTKQFVNLSNQSAQANFGKQDMDKLHISFSANTAEQLKIASVLSTLDDEIQKLKAQLKKLKIQKKGLMQLLLTGNIRVKI